MISYLGGGCKIKPESKRSIDNFHLRFSPKIWVQPEQRSCHFVHKTPNLSNLHIFQYTYLETQPNNSYYHITSMLHLWWGLVWSQYSSHQVTQNIFNAILERIYLLRALSLTVYSSTYQNDCLQYSIAHGVIVRALTNQIKDTILGQSNKCIWWCP